MNTAKMSEDLQVDLAIESQDIGTTDRTSAWFPVKNYRQIMGIANVDELIATKILTVALLQATTSGGSGSKALGSTVTATSAGSGGSPDLGAKLQAVVEASPAQLDTNNGFNHVAVKVTCDVNGKVGHALLVRGNGRFGPGAA